MIPRSFAELVDLLEGRPVAVVTGAGCSTESGIPDYRGSDEGSRTPTPIRYRAFVSDPEARRLYWARSSVGWLRVHRARPNPAHRALARLERAGAVEGVVTQNVDGLHHAAGSRRVVELHGSLDRVVCLGCGEVEARASVQRRLLVLNPGWEDDVVAPVLGEGAGAAAPDGDARIAPDGDAEVPDEAVERFRVPACRACGGVLKPDVVFFGESVPDGRVRAAWDLYGEAGTLLVAGSSLAVWSGYRFVARAAEEGVPVAIVNLGPTRGDDDARVRLTGKVGEVLPAVAEELVPQTRPPAARREGAR
jgi:NAD-dependent SIR2 family protein deacetylase